MIKRVALVVALALACIPITSFALGLGPITMRSALNQPLLAEIDIHSAQPGDLDGLAVRLAANEDFQRVNVERSAFLNRIHFSVALRTDGSPYIKLTTDDPVTEPYLDFLIEARWARGRALKEYTVLVDPPVLTAETPAPVQQAKTAPVFSQPTRQAVRSTPRAQPQRQARKPAATRRAPTPTRKMTQTAAGGHSYTVKPNDTLSGIADQMRPDSVSLNQMMLALLKANPRAFYNNNINQLKAGYVLRMNDPSTAAAISKAEANREVHSQYLAWREGSSGRLVQQTDMAEAGGGQVASTAGSRAGKTVAKSDAARLKLVAPGKEGAGTGSTGADNQKVKQLQQDLILATEALDANKAETDELKTRLAELEDQLTNMQRLINLKDEEMLALQNNLKEQQGAKPTAEAEAPKKKAAAPAPKQAEEKQSFIDSILSSDTTLIGVVAILILAVVAWLVVRRRKMQEGFQESILNVGMADSVAAASSQMMQPSSESNMVSDFAMSGMDSMQQDSADVDPISEADVYLAYGRHQQAEDIIRQALEKSPERLELHVKLLEVLHAAKNRAGFEEQAQALHEQLGGDETNEIWMKVAALGSQIAPDNPLFGASAESFATDNALAGDFGGVTVEEEDLLDFDFDEDESLGADMQAATAGTDDDDLDFDVSALDFDLEEEDATDNAIANVDAMDEADEELDNALDFDLGDDGELEISQASVMQPVPEEEQLLSLDDDEEEHIDLDALDLESSDSGEDALSELSLEGLGQAAESEVALEDIESEGEEALDLDLELDLDKAPLPMDLDDDDNTVVALNVAADDEESLGEDIFADVDEIGTKLDLAKAYVDMGDSDGARSILDEVLEEGDDTQKQQAEQLLQQMG